MLEWMSPVRVVSVSDRKMASWQTTSAVLYSTEDYVAASFRSMENEKMVKRPVGRPGKSARSKATARCKKTRRMSRLHHMYLLMVRSPQMSSLFDGSAPWSKSSTFFCTAESVPLN